MERTPEGSPARRMSLFLTLKRTLAKHALAEEDIVYPQLLSQAQESGRTKHLYDEHADIKIHLYELEQLLTRNENWADRVRSLRALIEPHIRQEEDEEFPKLRQTLAKWVGPAPFQGRRHR
jgi:hemerythrin superfamily protein